MRRTVLLLAAAALAITPAAAQQLRYLNSQDVAEAQRDHVGGCDDLFELHHSGKLDELFKP